jgi:hypothetical protein
VVFHSSPTQMPGYTINYATTVFFHVLSNSFVNHPFIRCYMVLSYWKSTVKNPQINKINILSGKWYCVEFFEVFTCLTSVCICHNYDDINLEKGYLFVIRFISPKNYSM